MSYGRSGREREDQLSQPNFEDSHAVFRRRETVGEERTRKALIIPLLLCLLL